MSKARSAVSAQSYLPRIFAACCAAAGIFAACASAPSFHPSKPIDEAQSLQEGLLLCNEYRVPAEPKRPVVVRPFLKCVDEVKDAFPAESSRSKAFPAFHREFHILYDSLTEDSWSDKKGAELDLAIHAALRALWQEQAPKVTALERELFLKIFPITAEQLGASRWAVSSKPVLDARLERLKAALASLFGEARLDSQQAATEPGSNAQATVSEICSRYRHLKSEAQYLSGLWQDQYDMSLLAPGSPLSATARQKFQTRLDAAMRELEEIRPRVAEARANGSFRVLACP